MISVNIPDLSKCDPLELEALAAMMAVLTPPSVRAKREEMTATQYLARIAVADQPDTGVDVAAAKSLMTGTPIEPDVSQAFRGGAPPPNPPAAHMPPPTPSPEPQQTDTTQMPPFDAGMTGSLPPPPPPVPLQADASAGAGSTPPAHPPLLDAAGLPWDGRIHSSSRERIANNTWKKKRGADPSLVATVEQQLRTTLANSGIVPPPLPTPAGSPPPPPPETGAVRLFPQLMQYITGRMGAGTLDHARIAAACESVGIVGGLPSVMAVESKIPALRAALELL